MRNSTIQEFSTVKNHLIWKEIDVIFYTIDKKKQNKKAFLINKALTCPKPTAQMRRLPLLILHIMFCLYSMIWQDFATLNECFALSKNEKMFCIELIRRSSREVLQSVYVNYKNKLIKMNIHELNSRELRPLLIEWK